ncbi:hypothetical protein AGDE_14639 [Angomonas deanei]|uniref:Amastin surface glycoprotein, putative n=1 Tax=Angomonas deanei TaxID=59799 RepID=A0A7G2CRF4_9TRYP|nr:hypothetical protein AGDE_14639 [Angomonas deanei]CAD2221591.1 Amastin surface glycoprotein, putative [Angomonas deanei]|eukprot:EPY20505.1 hypothetical protein AGDE_14639 [Angomonas deanei]
MKAAASFSIIAIGLYGFFIIASIAYVCKCIGAKAPLIILAFFGFITGAVPWACICGLYYNPTCGTFVGPMKERSKFAAGFAFLILGFALQFFVFLFACLI